MAQEHGGGRMGRDGGREGGREGRRTVDESQNTAVLQLLLFGEQLFGSSCN